MWCPQVISGIGEQRDTLHDRSIHIEMRRKLPGERSRKLPSEYYEQQIAIRRRCLRWAEDNAPRLKKALSHQDVIVIQGIAEVIGVMITKASHMLKASYCIQDRQSVDRKLAAVFSKFWQDTTTSIVA